MTVDREHLPMAKATLDSRGSGAGEAPARMLRDVTYAAARLGLEVTGVYRLVENKQLTFIDVSSTGTRAMLRFTDEDLDAFIASRRRHAEDLRRTVVEPPSPMPASRRGRRRGTVLQLPGADRYANR